MFHRVYTVRISKPSLLNLCLEWLVHGPAIFQVKQGPNRDQTGTKPRPNAHQTQTIAGLYVGKISVRALFGPCLNTIN